MQHSRMFILIIVLGLLLAACAGPVSERVATPPDTAVPPPADNSAQTEEVVTPTEVPMVNLPDLGPAAEFRNETWLNTDEPVTLASLQGKVVLLEFWTFG